jgi:type IV secretory pathway ATPase VirB11/archaellum biosynthesis ATPase
MTETPSSPALLSETEWPKTLAAACQAVISAKSRAVLCLIGRPGSGKSTLGKDIRKKGLPGIPPSRIAVIDDGVLSVPLLGIFNRRIKHRSNERDELAPFRPHLRGKELLVYVSSRPERRLSACDIVVLVRCDEDDRLRRLEERNEDGERRFQKSATEPDIISIPATRCFEFQSR